MQFPITANITLIQLSPDDQVHAYVTWAVEGDVRNRSTQEFRLGTLPDAVDTDMWMQMAAASVCDAL